MTVSTEKRKKVLSINLYPHFENELIKEIKHNWNISNIFSAISCMVCVRKESVVHLLISLNFLINLKLRCVHFLFTQDVSAFTWRSSFKCTLLIHLLEGSTTFAKRVLWPLPATRERFTISRNN